jgi:hypothetical protein
MQCWFLPYCAARRSRSALPMVQTFVFRTGLDAQLSFPHRFLGFTMPQLMTGPSILLQAFAAFPPNWVSPISICTPYCASWLVWTHIFDYFSGRMSIQDYRPRPQPASIGIHCVFSRLWLPFIPFMTWLHNQMFLTHLLNLHGQPPSFASCDSMDWLLLRILKAVA